VADLNERQWRGGARNQVSSGGMNSMRMPVSGSVTGAPWSGLTYFCTTRNGGVSQGRWSSMNLGPHTHDAPQHVAENRRRLLDALPGAPLWLEQVHGTHVVDADKIPVGSVFSPEGDAAVTMQPGRVLAIMTADCLPVVIADAQGVALGVVHAGWRGLAAGVLESTLNALRERVPADAVWRAWVGPAISQPHFEVGADVFRAFVNSDPDTARYFLEERGSMKWRADLPGLARHRLQRAGVARIELSGLCTYAEQSEFYSYRRQNPTGRMATLAWLGDGR
jgi:YfiH family protein